MVRPTNSSGNDKSSEAYWVLMNQSGNDKSGESYRVVLAIKVELILGCVVSTAHFFGRFKLKQSRLNLYTIDLKYIRAIAKTDDNVMSISPQIGKSSRPFIGIIIICNEKQYCVPLSSPKAKHANMKNDVDFSKIYDPHGTLIGVLNFNNMIPVRQDVIIPLDIKIHKNDSPSTVHYKKLTMNQLTFCRQNQDAIITKANKLYKMITDGKVSHLLRKRCCDFTALEQVLDKFQGNS